MKRRVFDIYVFLLDAAAISSTLFSNQDVNAKERKLDICQNLHDKSCDDCTLNAQAAFTLSKISNLPLSKVRQFLR